LGGHFSGIESFLGKQLGRKKKKKTKQKQHEKNQTKAKRNKTKKEWTNVPI